MPLADVPGLVAAFVEGASQRVLLARQVFEIGYIDDSPFRRVQVPVRVDPVGDADGGRIFAGEDTSARRRADRAGGVGIAEAHALAREAVDIGRLVEGAAITDQILPAHIVDKDEDDIGRFHASAFSMAATKSGSSGVVLGSKRASVLPSLSMRNFSKFQVMSSSPARCA